MARRIAFTGKNELVLEDFTPGPPGPDEVALETLYSLVSTGTESTCLNRHFESGTHWDRWVQYPFYPGYTVVGRVTHVGQAVTNIKVGHRVCTRLPHCSAGVVPADSCVPVPDQVPDPLAPWAKLAQIAFTGVRAADYRIADTVLVIGAGPIGQMSVRWAHVAGVEAVAIVDLISQRLTLAKKSGASIQTLDHLPSDANTYRELLEGSLPTCVIDTTGNPVVLPHALGAVRNRGRVVLLGDTGMFHSQHLTSDVVTRGVTIVGVHHTSGLPELAAVYRYFFKLLLEGRFSMSGMNTHEFSPQDCREAYDLVNTSRGETMGILFKWQ